MSIKKRTISVVLVVIILSSGLFMEPASSNHENPEEMEENLSSLFETLNRTSELMERSLEEALSVNYSIVENQEGNISYEYDEEALSNSKERASDIEQELSKPNSVLEDIKGEIKSDEFLEEYFVPLYKIATNLTSYSKRHRYLISNLTNMFIESDEEHRTSDIDIGEAFNNTHDHLTNMYERLENVNVVLQNYKRNNVDLTGLEFLIKENHRLLDQYEDILENIGYEFEVPPTLFIYGPKRVYPSDEFDIKVNFFDGRIFNNTADITLLMGGIKTDFEYDIKGNTYIFNYNIGWAYEVSSKLVFSAEVDDSGIISEKLTVQVVPYPSRIELETEKEAYYDENIRIHGVFQTEADIDLTEIELNAPYKEISPDVNGSFVLEYESEKFRWGVSEIKVYYESPENGTISPSYEYVSFEVSIPTDITIIDYTDTVRYDDVSNFTLEGKLVNISREGNRDFEGLGLQEIEVYLNGKRISANQTDEEGYFTFSFSSDKELEVGTYFISISFEGPAKYRSVDTEEIQFEIVEEERKEEKFWTEPLFLGAIAIFIFFIIGLVYLTDIKEEGDGLPETTSNEQEQTASGISIPAATTKKEITSAYRSFLERMQELEIVKLSKGKTHREVEDELNSHPSTNEIKKEISYVTNLFEKALFTNREIVQSEIEKFNSSLSKLMKEVLS